MTDRRDLLRLGSGLIASAAATLAGCSPTGKPAQEAVAAAEPTLLPEDTYDYIVVGSGAGGGPVAANLAEAGYKVLLLEAGSAAQPLSYEVPAFHAWSTEEDALRWSFYVQHYGDPVQARRDRKYVEPNAETATGGILYPRAGTLGGCTAHNAMIFVYPHNSDWGRIAALTGDPSWSAGSMRTYFERLERCTYVEPSPFGNPSRHGFDGWLTTSVADPRLLVRDKPLARLVVAAAKQSFADNDRSFSELLERLRIRFRSFFDPNDWRVVERSFEGFTFTPLTVKNGRRNGARERILAVQSARPQQLIVKTGALAGRVLLDESARATGVEYYDAPHLYRADPLAPRAGDLPPPRVGRAVRGVVIAGGAFNTPQLLMLSGIGPPDELARHGIPLRVALPGVGKNLQDRYEVGVVYRMKNNFRLIQDATFHPPAPGEPPDPLLRAWQATGRGPYATNGAVAALVERSAPERAEPDLYLFGVIGYFEGYKPGYSREVRRDQPFFTWAILKAHTANTAGEIRLRSSDPRDPPDINFRYFAEGNDAGGEDLASVVAGVQQARSIMARVSDLVAEEMLPGPAVAGDDAVGRYIKDNAWGHHASCSCKIGADGDPLAVLDAQFRVRGVKGLRVADASVFPNIPGFFIVSATYMVGEKASDALLADAKSWSPPAG